MMKIKTNKLTGAALDWAVAKCEGGTDFWYDTIATYWIKLDGKDRALSKGWSQSFTPSTEWAQGGPIIERERICPCPSNTAAGSPWSATDLTGHITQFGPTPLIAAMRCYVASKLGDEVDVPEELA